MGKKKEKTTISENHSQIKGYVINLFNKKRAAMGMPLVPFEEPKDIKLKREAKEAINGARKLIDTLEELINGKVTMAEAEKIVESLDIKIGEKANVMENLIKKIEMAVNKPQVEEVQDTSSSVGAEQEAKPVENTESQKATTNQEKKPESKKATTEPEQEAKPVENTESQKQNKTGLNPIVPTEKKEQPKLPHQQKLTGKEKKELRKQQRQQIPTPEATNPEKKEEVAGVAKEVSIGDNATNSIPTEETGSYVGAGNNPYLQNIASYVKTYDVNSKQCMDSLGQAMGFNNKPVIFEDGLVKFWVPKVLQTPDLQGAVVQ